MRRGAPIAALMLTASLVLPSGCGLLRAERMREALRAWHDHNIHDAIAKMGPPTEVYPNGETSIYLWERQGPAISTFSGSSWRSNAWGTATAMTPICRYWFVVDADGWIRSSRLDGQCWTFDVPVAR